MELASVRRNFSSNVFFGPEIWCPEPMLEGDRPAPGCAYSWYGLDGAVRPQEAVRRAREMIQARWGGVRRVLVLIHGYNSDVIKSRSAFREIDGRMGSHYDRVVGFLWPGSNRLLGYWTAWQRARRAGDLLADLLLRMRLAGVEQIDINAHSMGCAVALRALCEHPARVVILNGPAVDRDALAPGGEFAAALSRMGQAVIAWSRTDPALGIGGVLARWRQEPMGAMGPLFLEAPAHVRLLDLTGSVLEHGAYRRHPDIYRAWLECLDPAGKEA